MAQFSLNGMGASYVICVIDIDYIKKSEKKGKYRFDLFWSIYTFKTKIKAIYNKYSYPLL